MGWRDDLIRVGITAGTAALMGKGGKDRARKALEVAFPQLVEIGTDKLTPKDKEKSKQK